jgi:hypothetical protein
LSYPPKPTRCEDFEKLLKLLGCAILENTALYVSSPITSGKRLADWHIKRDGRLPDVSDPAYREEHSRHVVEPNRLHSQVVVDALRRKFPMRPTIDPSYVDNFVGWTQDDYRFFWGIVVEKFAERVIFVDGWQYSLGCAYEFLVTQRHQIDAFNEEGIKIEIESGTQLIRDALATFPTESEAYSFLHGIYQELLRMISQGRTGKIYA